MHPHIHSKSIHQIVADNLAELGMADAPCTRMTVITHDGFCVGRRFLFDRFQAVWRMAEGIVEFYSDDGELLRTAGVDPETPQARRTA